MKHNFNKETFKEKLEANGQFPMLYMFKFIVPTGKESEVAALFPKNEMKVKESSKGKYVSTTIKVMMETSDQILDIYEQASEIEGLISL